MAPIASAGDAKRTYNKVFFVQSSLMAALAPRKRATFLKRTANTCRTWWDWILSYLFYLSSSVCFGHYFAFLQHVLGHPVLLSYVFIPKICNWPRILL